MTLESIEKLRESLKDCISETGIEPNRFDTYWITAKACDMLIDEIEREVLERYMELPLDEDGIPIHEGDLIQFVNKQGGTGAPVEVCAVSKYYVYYNEGKHFYRADCCCHFKPRTIEDVLQEMLCEETLINSQYPWENPELIAKYAAEICELLEIHNERR